MTKVVGSEQTSLDNGVQPTRRISSAFIDYYRCPEAYAALKSGWQLTGPSGYFRWGQDIVCYGRSSSGTLAQDSDGELWDMSPHIGLDGDDIALPFDPDELIENLRREKYAKGHWEPGVAQRAVRHLYYLLRPSMSVSFRRYLQRFRLRDWKSLRFPEWPLDTTVDKLERRLMALAMKAAGIDSMPFIWFWPDNFLSCLIITHDVETAKGRDFCSQLMEIDSSFGFRGSYQVVPEKRYTVPPSYLSEIVGRGCEVNVHDLNHDGHLYSDYEEFLNRARKINDYVDAFDAEGFRAAIMYRNPDWYNEFRFSYDMSIPNIGHIDPQRGGCCTVMPYFIGDLVELPLTCTQDYALFHMLNNYSLDLWRGQIEKIVAENGLITVLVHPDYVIETRAQKCYRELLRHLAEQTATNRIWATLPREVARWWRQRSRMQLIDTGKGWTIEGEGKERAQIAYATLDGDTVRYRFN